MSTVIIVNNDTQVAHEVLKKDTIPSDIGAADGYHNNTEFTG